MEVRKNACNAEGVICRPDKQQEWAKSDQSRNVKRVFAEGGSVTSTGVIQPPASLITHIHTLAEHVFSGA